MLLPEWKWRYLVMSVVGGGTWGDCFSSLSLNQNLHLAVRCIFSLSLSLSLSSLQISLFRCDTRLFAAFLHSYGITSPDASFFHAMTCYILSYPLDAVSVEGGGLLHKLPNLNLMEVQSLHCLTRAVFAPMMTDKE